MRRVLAIMLIFIPLGLKSQNLSSDNLFETLSKFEVDVYGAMNYYAYNWQTDSVKRNAIDQEVLILELDYNWTDKIKLNTEIEFEHGGTGSEVEFDRFEEFGEFEFDISKGGEVIVEQMNLEFGIGKSGVLKVGRVKVPFGTSFMKSEPTDFLTITNSETEVNLLPINWTENGFYYSNYLDTKQRWKYHLAFINGLDGSAFSSANWIKRGNQTRFEMVNAENFALASRLDYGIPNKMNFGISVYGSLSTTDNRPKPDLKVSTPLGITEFHINYKWKYFSFSGLVLYGYLHNSETLSNHNRNLSNNLNVKRSPVGQSILGCFGQVAIKLIGEQGTFGKLGKTQGIAYTRIDYYDSMYKTEGKIFNNPRWERKSITFGSVYKIIEDVQFKFQYTIREVGAPAPTSVDGGTRENTLGLGFTFHI